MLILPDDNADTFDNADDNAVASLSLILSSIAVISFYILSKRFFLKREGLSDARIVSITKNEFGFAVHFLQRFKNFLKSIYDKWLNAICWSSSFFGIFIIK